MPSSIEHSFTSAMPFPAVVIGTSERIEAANELAVELFGDQILGQHYITALRQPGLLEQIETCFASAKKVGGSYQTTIDQKNFIYDVHIAPMDKGILLTFVDTTDAHELDNFRRDFVANVSHELRTPLASVLGFVETLRGHAKDDPKARERFLEFIDRETQRMASLVDDLLSLSRVEEEGRKRPTNRLEVHSLIKQLISELSPIVSSANSTVSLFDNSDGATALLDASQMHQVFRNLIENAVRYGEPAGTISIHISSPSYDARLRTKALQISVTDTGKGIAAHHIPRLTERFYRVDSHRTREVGGTGLGLAIVKHIIQRHRGRLVIESTLGKGSTFTVFLPVFE